MGDPPYPAPPTPLLRAAGVAMAYAGGIEALAGVDLEARPGELLALVGPSGCGKSTLLRMLAGLAVPTAGRVEVAGRAPAEARRSGAVRVSLVAQDANLLPWRTAAENVGLPLELAGVPAAAAAPRIAAELERVGLSDAAARRPRELSGGMRMRVALARALVTRPELLLLDEPFGALDELTREALIEDLAGLRARDRWTGVLVTHSLAEAAFLADRVAVMTPRPGTVAAVVPVPFPFPRHGALRATGEFAGFVGGLSLRLRGKAP